MIKVLKFAFVSIVTSLSGSLRTISKIYLPSTIQQIGMRAFVSLDSYYLSIYFEGTKKEWRSIKKHATIFKDNFTEDISRTIYCSDGDLVYKAKKLV